MNIALILSSGVGARFGSNIPKQYLPLNGKEVISYVIDAVKAAKKIDKIIVVAHYPYIESINKSYGLETVEGGDSRNQSLRNGVDYIKKNYKCTNIIVLDAVRPLISSELIDFYISKLEEYSICVTASKITDSLNCLDFHICDRDRYYLTASPMSFKFNELDTYLKADSKLVEVLQMYPEQTKVYLNFDFKTNFKVTYKEDIKFIEAYLNISK